MEASDEAWLEHACLGGGLPPEAEQHLRLAGIAYSNDEVAEAHLDRAMEAAPGHAAVLIGRYRFYFYKGRLVDALKVAKDCLLKAAHDNALMQDWRMVRHEDANFGSFEAILPRFYLFTLKAYGYLNMRLGNLVEGREIVLKLLELDPGDKIGAKVLLNVLDRIGLDEDD